VVTLDAAYAACALQARSHYENFPVASRLLPAAMRPHIAAIYAFARTADDFADEGDAPPAERLARLDAWLTSLRAALDDRAPDSGTRAPVFVALPHTIRACGLPVSLFEDLVSAFKQDVVKTRYESWDEVLDYCRRSADPVGRLVLRVAGVNDGRLHLASDAVCTALQLTNFWQDLDVDWRKGRLYVPREDRERLGADERDLDARRWTPSWQAVMTDLAARTRALFERGRPVCDGVAGRLRYELRFTWLGGRRILDRLEQERFDVFAGRPSLGVPDGAALAWGVLRWKP
jgi:squalene synthase HpnC